MSRNVASTRLTSQQVDTTSYVEHHMVEALPGALAEADGDENLSRRLRAEAKLQLICMSDEELWEFAKLTSSPPERLVKLACKGIKQAIVEIWATSSEWGNDLVKRPMAVNEAEDDE